MYSGLWSPGHGWEEEATKWTGELLLLAWQLQAVHVLEVFLRGNFNLFDIGSS